MEAWLFKTPVGPQAHQLNPLQFYTIKKEEAGLGRIVHEAKVLWNREIFYSKTSSINGWRYDLLVLLFRFCFRVLSRICSESEVYANSWYRSHYLCLGVLYVVATVGFSLCVCIGCEWQRAELIFPAFLF